MNETDTKKVLIIDDEEPIRDYLAYLLESAGYAVEQSIDGLDGLNKFSKNQFDLVITDISMPNKDGIETIMSIRSSRKPVKIIAMSGADKKDWVLRIAEFYKADAVIKKPFDRAEVLSLVGEVCSDNLIKGDN